MDFAFRDLGLIEFQDAYKIQQEVHQDIVRVESPGTFLFCRHFPVITLGRLAKKENIFLKESQLLKHGIKVYHIDRGGDVTYHGPGQLVVYSLLNLHFFRKDIRFFLRKLEEAVESFLDSLGIQPDAPCGLTGVWVGKKKIASIGISVRRWVSFHGVSINIKNDDLANYRFIRPCGMDIQMTSLEGALRSQIDIEAIKAGLISSIRASFS